MDETWKTYAKWNKTFSSVQSLSRVWLFATPWTAALQASLSITNSWTLLKLMSMSRWCHPTSSSSVIPFSSCLHSFPGPGSFQMSELLLSHKKEHIWVSSNEVDGPRTCYTEWNKSERGDKYHILTHIYMESRKMILKNLFTGQQWRNRHRE